MKCSSNLKKAKEKIIQPAFAIQIQVQFVFITGLLEQDSFYLTAKFLEFRITVNGKSCWYLQNLAIEGEFIVP